MPQKDKLVRAKLIANPNAGNPSDTTHDLKWVVTYLEKKGLKVDVALASPKEEATPIVRQAIKDGYKLVIALGGDGTIEAVMRAMIGSKVRLAIIPLGTENNIAKSLHVPTELKEACALVASGTAVKLDVGQVTTRKGKKFFFFEMATVGLSAAVYPPANKIASGKLFNIKVAAITFIHQEPKPKVFLTLDDESKIEIETMLVMVSNTPIFGKNFLVAPDASVQDGLLDVSVYPDFNKAELLRYYADIMDEDYSNDGKVQHYQARKIKVKTSPKLDVMADGVELGRGTITIKVHPGALRVITGKEISTRKKPKAAAEMRPVSNRPAIKNAQGEKGVLSPG